MLRSALDWIGEPIAEFRKRPALVIAALLTVGVSVGTAGSVFAVADAMILRPLPYSNPNQLVEIRNIPQSPSDDPHPNIGDFLSLQKSPTFTSMAAFHWGGTGRVEGIETAVDLQQVSEKFFDVLGSRMFLGRPFTVEDFSGTATSCVVTYRVWSRSFHGRQDSIGSRLVIDGPRRQECQVVGVLNEDFLFPNTELVRPEVLIPYVGYSAAAGVVRGQSNIIARLSVPRSPAVDEELRASGQLIESQYPKLARNRRISAVPLREAMFGSGKQSTTMLLAITLSVLVLASVNLTHLFRASLRGRSQTLWLMGVLGATPRRIRRQLLTETAVLGLGAAILSVLVTVSLRQWMIAIAPPALYVYVAAAFGGTARVVVFVFMTSILAVLVFAGLPAVRLPEFRPDFRSTPRRHRSSWSTTNVLLISQLVIAFAVVVAATSMVVSFARSVRQPLGFSYSSLRIIQPILGSGGGSGQVLEQTNTLIYQQLGDKFGSKIGVSDGLPTMATTRTAERPDVDGSNRATIGTYGISGNVLDILGVRLVGGRVFSEAELRNDAPVAIVDQQAADQLWRGESALGRTLKTDDGAVRSIVGLVSSISTDLQRKKPAPGLAFVPIGHGVGRLVLFSYSAGSGVSPQGVADVVKSVVPTASVNTVPLQPFRVEMAKQRFFLTLFLFLGSAAIALTVISVAGVTTNRLSEQTDELLIRQALGATPSRLHRMAVAQHAIVPGAIAIAAGFVPAWIAAGGMRDILFHTDGADPRIVAAASGLILTMLVVCTVAPMWRISRFSLSSVTRKTRQ